MNILVLNAGSSSLKFRLYRMEALRPLSEAENVLAGGQVDRIGQPNASMTFTQTKQDGSAATEAQAVGAQSAAEAAQVVLQRLTAPETAGQAALVVDAVGHRIVHGGGRFYAPTRIDAAVLDDLRALTELAPLHNPAGVAGIEATLRVLPHVPNVAVFDTAFHHNLPTVTSRYALPLELSERLELRRYGFHGISYQYVTDRLLHCLGRSAAATRLILCHLGNGASVCAVRDGQSVDTSMGFTPLEGLIMGTRSGDIDPGLVLHLMRVTNQTPDQMDDVLNHQSGLRGLAGNSDARDLELAAKAGDAAAQAALNAFAYRVRKYIGAYAAALGGVDALAFTAGIGEHSAQMRARICAGLEFLALSLDVDRNGAATGREPAAIGVQEGSRVWIIPTDEERQIARETYTLLQ